MHDEAVFWFIYSSLLYFGYVTAYLLNNRHYDDHGEDNGML